MTWGSIARETKNVSGWIMQRQLHVVTWDSYDGGCVVELVKDLKKAGPNVFRHFGDADDVAEFWHGIGGGERI